MNEARRSIPVVLAHFIIGFIICITYSFFQPVPSVLLPPFIFSWHFYTGLLLFFEVLPALMLSGILVGYSLSFGKLNRVDVRRWSPVFLEYLKGAFVVSLVCIGLYVVCIEGVAPFLESGKKGSEAKSSDYHDYMLVARNAVSKNDFVKAESPLWSALQIWSSSEEALLLNEKVQYGKASALDALPSEKKQLDYTDPGPEQGSASLDVLTNIKLAREAISSVDYFSAHYYAMQAWRLASNMDPNKMVAMEIASEAWNLIGAGVTRLAEAGEASIYDTKLVGYSAIQNGDFLKAYYIFLTLQERIKNEEGQLDTDVDKFLEISKQGILKTHFFTDELVHLQLFESSRNIFFIIRSADGTLDAIFIGGITYTRSSRRDIAYLRNLEIVRFNNANETVFHIGTEYAKMFPYRGLDSVDRPQVLLRSIDRQHEGDGIFSNTISGLPTEQDLIMQVLDMPYKDFSLVVSANNGLETMQLIEIMKFITKAERYGFSKEPLFVELLNRLSEPFILMILSVFSLILAWRFRIAQNRIFKAWWIMAVPVFPFVSLYTVTFIRYCTRVCNSLVVKLFPSYSIFLILGGLFILLFGVSIYFFSQRSE